MTQPRRTEPGQLARVDQVLAATRGLRLVLDETERRESEPERPPAEQATDRDEERSD